MGDQQHPAFSVQGYEPYLVAAPVKPGWEPDRPLIGLSDAEPDLAGQVGADNQHSALRRVSHEPVVALFGKRENGLT